MIASLPMYWRAENAAAWHRLWLRMEDAAAEIGFDVPALSPPEVLAAEWDKHWLSPDLVLSQTCGLPFRTRLKDRVTYVGTFDFGIIGPPGSYTSHLIARKGLGRADWHNLRLAFNAADSQSGWAVAEDAFFSASRARNGPVGTLIKTGSHAASWRAVSEARADIAYVDSVSWRLLRRFDRAEQSVDAISETAPTPGLPLITSFGRDPEPLRAALHKAVDATGPEDAKLMGGLQGFHVLDQAAYHAIQNPRAPDAILPAQ